jgi:hypothetical protein
VRCKASWCSYRHYSRTYRVFPLVDHKFVWSLAPILVGNAALVLSELAYLHTPHPVPRSCECRNQCRCGRRNPIPLKTVAESLAQSLPQQQEPLALLKHVSAYTSAHLTAPAEWPPAYSGGLTLTPQCSLRRMALVSPACVCLLLGRPNLGFSWLKQSVLLH